MVKFKRMKLINWYLYQVYKPEEFINFEDFTAIVALNGTGKTALIDAYKYAAYGDSSFNQAAGTKGKGRTLLSYIRGQKDRGADKYYRPVQDYPNVTTHIVLEWEDDTGLFCTGVIIDMNSNNDHTAKWYVMNDTRLEDVPITAQNGGKDIPLNIHQFQEATQALLYDHHQGIHNILDRLGMRISMEGGYPDYLRQCRSIMKYDTEANISEFIRNNILPREDIPIDNLREEIESVRNAKAELILLQEENGKLEEILQKYNELDNANRHVIENNICKIYDNKVKETNDYEEEIHQADADELEKQQQEKELDGLKEKLNRTRSEYDRLNESLNSNEVTKALTEKRRHCEDLKKQEKEFSQEKNAMLSFQDKLKEMCDVISREKIDKHTASIMNSLHSEEIPAFEKQTAVNSIKEAVSQARDDALLKKQEQQDDLKENQAEQQRLKIASKKFQRSQNSSDETKSSENLRDEINAEIRKQQRTGKAYLAFEHVYKYKDDSWQDAIEKFLGRKRYTVLVDPEAYDIADAVFAKTENKTAHLFNTKRLMQKATEPAKDSVVNFLDIPQKVTKKYFDYELGRMSAVADKELKNHDYAIAKTGRVVCGMDNYYASPRGLHLYYLGYQSSEKNLELANKRLEELEEQATEIKARLDADQSRERQLKSYLEEFQGYDWDVCRKLKQTQDEIKECEKTIAEYERSMKEDSEYIYLRTRLMEVETERNDLEQRIETTDRNIGSLNANISHHKSEAEKKDEMIKNAETLLEQCQKDHPEEAARVMHQYDTENRRPVQKGAEQRWIHEQKEATTKLNDLQANYRKYCSGAPVEEGKRTWYEQRQKFIGIKGCGDANKKIEEETEKEEKIFKKEFVLKIKNNCDDIQRRIKEINNELKKHPFGGVTYGFRQYSKIGSGFETILDYANKKDENGDLLIALEDGQELDEEMDQILDAITEGASKDFDQYADYRNYMDYDILCSNGDDEPVRLSEQNGTNSGAEVQIPYLLMLFSALLLTYGSAEDSDSMRMVIMDEPFTKMDSGKIRTMIKFMKQQKFQTIFCMPRGEEAVLEACDSLITLSKIDHTENSYIYIGNEDLERQKLPRTIINQGHRENKNG